MTVQPIAFPSDSVLRRPAAAVNSFFIGHLRGEHAPRGRERVAA